MFRKIFPITMVMVFLLGLTTVQGINEQEIIEQDVDLYFPPYLEIDVTVNASATSIHDGLSPAMIDPAGFERGWAWVQMHLRASTSTALITPLIMIETGDGSYEPQQLTSFVEKVYYPTTQNEQSEIAYETRESSSTTQNKILEKHGLVKDSTTLVVIPVDFEAGATKPEKMKVDFGDDAPPTKELSYHDFLSTGDVNDTVFNWVTDALNLDNFTQIYELNTTSAEMEFKFPFRYDEDAFQTTRLTIRKKLMSIDNRAFDTLGPIKKKYGSGTGSSSGRVTSDYGAKFDIHSKLEDPENENKLKPWPIRQLNGVVSKIYGGWYTIGAAVLLTMVAGVVGIYWWRGKSKSRRQR